MDKAIVVVGSSNTDMIIKMPRLPKPGETIIGGSFSTAPGGKGANQAVGAARAGGKVALVARVGEDMFGQKAVEGFLQDGINVDYVFRDKNAPSGVALIFVDEKGENSIGVASGANANLSPSDIETAKDCIASAAIVLMQLEIPPETVKATAAIAAEHGVRLILNPAPARPLHDDLLKNVTILTPNDSESELLTGIKVEDEASAARAAQTLQKRGVETVLVTLGSRGAYVAAADYTGIVPAFPVKAEDTTAAGDIFNGVLALSLAENKSIVEATRVASAAAALAVTKLGAQTSAPQRSEIESFLKERSN